VTIAEGFGVGCGVKIKHFPLTLLVVLTTLSYYIEVWLGRPTSIKCYAQSISGYSTPESATAVATACLLFILTEPTLQMSTRKLCYRKDEQCALYIHGFLKIFMTPWLRPRLVFPTFFMSFCSDPPYECSFYYNKICRCLIWLQRVLMGLMCTVLGWFNNFSTVSVNFSTDSSLKRTWNNMK